MAIPKLVDEKALLLPRYQHGTKLLFDKSIGASYSGSVFNLSCTIMGAGIMSLPATMKVLGVVPGVLLIFVAAYLTEASVELLMRFSRPGSLFSYSDAMGEAFGVLGRMAVQIIVVINNIGVVIIYLIIVEDVLSGTTLNGVHRAGVLEGWFGEQWWTGRAFVLIVLTVVVFIPLICLKRIDSLRHTSAISVALAVVFLAIVTGITIFKLIDGSIETPRLLPHITNVSSLGNLFTAVPVVVCAYVCHYNVHTIESELQEPSKMQAVVRGSLALCAVVYAVTGLFGFLLFGDSIFSDLLSNFDTNLGIPYGALLNDIIRVSYACHIILIFPIVFYPLRLNLDGLLFVSSSTPLILDNLRFAFITLGLLVIVLFGAIFIPSIWVVFQFVGATAGYLIAFIFPASISLRDCHGIATKKDKIFAVFIIILAVFANAVATYSNVCSLLPQISG